MKLNAYAKINLSLDVVRKREDNYHDLKMIMQTVSLCDIITVKESDKRIITCDNDKIPCDEKNIAYKCAVALLREKAPQKGFEIHIEKHIPMAAGLAGGSSDGACVMKALNEIYNLGYSKEELCNIAKDIGADIPYCIMGGTYLSEGIGEILTPLTSFEHKHLLLVKPPIDVSTPWVFKNLNLTSVSSHPDTEKVIESLKYNDINNLCKYSANLLQTVTEKEYPEVTEIIDKMKETGALFSMMSGSGPTVFGIFENSETLDKAYNQFIKVYPDTFRVNTVNDV